MLIRFILLSLTLLLLNACKKDPADPEQCEDFPPCSCVGPTHIVEGDYLSRAEFINNTDFVFIKGQHTSSKLLKFSLNTNDSQLVVNGAGPGLSTDGKYVLSGLRFIDLNTGIISTFNPNLPGFDQAAYSLNGDFITGIINYGSLKKSLAILKPDGSLIDSIPFSYLNTFPDLPPMNSQGIIAAESFYNNRLGLIILNSNDKSYYFVASEPYTTGKQQLKALTWHPDNQRVFYSNGFGVYSYNIKTKELLHLKNGCSRKEYIDIDISPDGTKLLSTVILREQIHATKFKDHYHIYLLDLNTMVESRVF